MAERGRVALSLVERGWQGPRECSRRLGRRGIAVVQVVKGRLPADVGDLVPPEPWLTLIGVPRSWFRVGVWLRLARWSLSGRLGWVLTDHERTLREVLPWCRAAGVRALLIHETMDGYELIEDGAVRAVADVFGPSAEEVPVFGRWGERARACA